MKHSEQINELAAALVAASAEMPTVPKTASNPHFRSKYAPLDAMDAATRPVLARHGLVIMQGGEATGTPITQVVTRLLHKSGQWIETTAEARPAKDDPQGVMSVYTYLRRAGYAIVGAVSDDDDDGNGASKKPVETPRQEPKAAPVAPPAAARPAPPAQPPPAPPAPPARQATRELPNGDNSEEVVCGRVSTKDGKSARGPWTIYSTKVGDNWYGTFDHKWGFYMTRSHAEDIPITLVWKPGRKEGNRDIVDVAVPPDFLAAWEAECADKLSDSAPAPAADDGKGNDPF